MLLIKNFGISNFLYRLKQRQTLRKTNYECNLQPNYRSNCFKLKYLLNEKRLQ